MDSIAVETHFPRCYEKHVTNFSNQRFTDLMGIRVILGGLLRENRRIEGWERSFGGCSFPNLIYFCSFSLLVESVF